MSRDRAPKIVTVFVVLVALGIVIARKRATTPAASPATPQDAIYAMLDAARAGDPASYLSHYTGSLKTNLQQTVSEKGDAGFRNYLQSSNAEIKGVAVEEPKSLSDTEVQVRVEYVYADRNEAQTMYLEKRGDQWRISRVDSAERIKTLVPYGTPVQ